jgi:hypothetical protein
MTSKFPKYYAVGDAYVIVDYDPKTDEVFALNHLGIPYPVQKPLIDGYPISKEEFDKGVKEIRKRLGV